MSLILLIISTSPSSRKVFIVICARRISHSIEGTSVVCTLGYVVRLTYLTISSGVVLNSRSRSRGFHSGYMSGG